jgi:hypothetical protein
MKTITILLRILALLFCVAFLWYGYLYIDLKNSPELTAQDLRLVFRVYPEDMTETEKEYAEKYDNKQNELLAHVSKNIRDRKLQNYSRTSILCFLLSLILLLWSFDRNKLINKINNADYGDGVAPRS